MSRKDLGIASFVACTEDTTSEVPDLLDRVYDTLHQGAAVIGTALGVDMRDVTPPRSGDPAPTGPPFRIEEVIDGTTGKVVFAVTDGDGTSCDVPTREQANATLDALERKGAKVVRQISGSPGAGTGSGSGSGRNPAPAGPREARRSTTT